MMVLDVNQSNKHGVSMVNELVKVTVDEDGKQTVNARELHEFLESSQEFANWIKNRIEKSRFIEDVDFFTFDKTIKRKKGVRGASKIKEYHISVDMAKMIAMLENNKKGDEVRRYFIKCEETLKNMSTKALAFREYTKLERQTFSESVEDSGENDRMHGHGHSNYTLMVYEVLGLKSKYKAFKSDKPRGKLFRDTLTPDELQRVNMAEKLATTLLAGGFEYLDIKENLKGMSALGNKAKKAIEV